MAHAAPPGTTFTLLAETGAAVPGLAGVTLASVKASQVNEKGDVAFAATIAGAGVTTGNDNVICVYSGGTLSVAAREGVTVSDLPGLTLGELSPHFTLSEEGELISTGKLAGAAVNGNNDGVIYGSTCKAVPIGVD